MNKYKKLLSDTAVYGIGTFTSKLLVFLLTRLYTECLTDEQFGTADLITNMANLLIPLAAAGLCEGIFRFVIDAGENKKSVFSTAIFMLLASTAVFVAISPALLLLERFRNYYWIIVVYVLASNFHSACAQYVRACDKTKLFALQGILNTALTITFNIIFLVILPKENVLNGVTGYVLSIVIADIIVGLFLVISQKLYRDVKISLFDKATAKSMLKYSLPLIPTTIFWWVTNVSDRYMISYFVGLDQNGLYAASAKIPTLLILVAGVFSEAWQFSAVKTSDPKERSDFYSTVFSCFSGLIFMAGSLIIALSRVFATVLFAKSYYTAWTFIPVLAAAGVFSAFVNFLASIYMVKKRSMKSFLTAMTGALVNITLNFILIPETLNLFGNEIKLAGMGVQGATIATLVSYFVVFVIRSVDSKKVLAFRLGVPYIVLSSAFIALQISSMLFIENNVLLYALQAFSVVGIFAVNAKSLIKGSKSIISSIKGKK